MLYGTENPHGGDTYGKSIELDFSANVTPLGTPESVREAMRGALREAHRYPDPHCRALVSAIAESEGVPESFVLCGAGAAELIFAFSAAVRPKTAAETAPTFTEYAAALSRGGTRIDRYALSEEDGFEVGEGFLRFLSGKKPEAVFLCNPNNPTGRLLSPDILDGTLDFCRKTGARLFLDECFLDLSDGGEGLTGRLAEHPCLTIVKAFTKTYGLAGVRLGYCLSSDGELLRRLAAESPPWNVSVIAQAAGVAALKEKSFAEKARTLIREERTYLREELAKLGLSVNPSEANFLLVKGPEGLADALEREGVAVRRCLNFAGLDGRWYRIAVRPHGENER
ncbi:MAG: aminotransferase class I/II-fold pyridoxal phosphate-dependent enzyme, partial [Oscillospiraceae bacterium]|nr:aminotransferase class I/II-fold pyridoxal phosphate-dependent enzyme [Oscillospiraceae bacterium]